MPTYTKDAITSWGNADKHVDTSIADGKDFTNAAHTVIYARVSISTDAEFRPIGVIQQWNHTEQRQMEEVYELGSDIKYIIPGRTTGQISIMRVLINGADLANVLYGTYDADGEQTNTPITSIKDINSPIDLVFVTYHNDTDSTEHLVRYFENCYIVSRQESIGANQVVLAENCTLYYEKIGSFSLT